MKKILVISHVNPFSKSSGQSVRVCNTLKALLEYFEVTLLVPSYSNIAITEEFNGRINVRRTRYTPSFLQKVYSYTYLLKALKRSNFLVERTFSIDQLEQAVSIKDFDIVLFEYWHAFKTARFISEYYKIPVVCDTHNILTTTYAIFLKRYWMFWFVHKLWIKRYQAIEFEHALPSFNYLIAINEEERKQLAKLFGDSVILCPMGISEEYSRLTKQSRKFGNDSTFVLSFYGGLGSSHNAQAAVNVYKRIFLGALDQIDKLEYKVIGSNPSKRLIRKIKHPSVNITGYVADIQSAFAEVDLAVIPWEGKYGFRSRIIELMALGVPVITTPDAVWGMGFTDKVNVLLADSYEEMLVLIVRLYRNKEELSTISLNAQALIYNHYSFENTYNRLSNQLHNFC